MMFDQLKTRCNRSDYDHDEERKQMNFPTLDPPHLIEKPRNGTDPPFHRKKYPVTN